MNPKQRDVFLVSFPFSDLSGKKVRPVLVISNDTFNNTGEDVIVCGITSRADRKDGVTINNKDLEDGELFVTSAIRVDSLHKLDKRLLIKKIGRLKPGTFSRVLKGLYTLFK